MKRVIRAATELDYDKAVKFIMDCIGCSYPDAESVVYFANNYSEKELLDVASRVEFTVDYYLSYDEAKKEYGNDFVSMIDVREAASGDGDGQAILLKNPIRKVKKPRKKSILTYLNKNEYIDLGSFVKNNNLLNLDINNTDNDSQIYQVGEKFIKSDTVKDICENEGIDYDTASKSLYKNLKNKNSTFYKHLELIVNHPIKVFAKKFNKPEFLKAIEDLQNEVTNEILPIIDNIKIDVEEKFKNFLQANYSDNKINGFRWKYDYMSSGEMILECYANVEPAMKHLDYYRDKYKNLIRKDSNLSKYIDYYMMGINYRGMPYVDVSDELLKPINNTIQSFVGYTTDFIFDDMYNLVKFLINSGAFEDGTIDVFRYITK